MATHSWRNRLAIFLMATVSAFIAPVTAQAALAARATALQHFTVLRWSAVAVAAGGGPATGAYSPTFIKQALARVAVFDVLNTGTSPLTGMTLTSSGTSGLAPGTSVTYSECSVAWVPTSSGRVFNCPGTTTTLGTFASGNGSLALNQALPVGSRRFLRADASATDGFIPVTQTISIKVIRTQATAGRNR